MITLVEAPIQSTVGAEQRVMLHGVSWQTYQNISAALEPHPSVRLTYDRGVLEIMTVSFLHEKFKGIIGDIVKTIANEMEIDFVSSGQTTFQIERKAGGFEGDDSFYFSNLEQLRQQENIDLLADPPPALVVEVDLTSPSLNKFEIFSRLGVKELWRYHDHEVTIYELVGEDFIERGDSVFLPGVTAAKVTELIALHQQLPAYAWQKKVREYARQCKGK
jgi:Uma2 family endonuclease